MISLTLIILYIISLGFTIENELKHSRNGNIIITIILILTLSIPLMLLWIGIYLSTIISEKCVENKNNTWKRN